MSNDVVTFQENSGLQLAPEFMPLVEQGLTDDLSEGVGGGFAVVSIKAGRFRIKHKGNEIMITNERGDPVGSLDVIVLRANAHITKQWYNKQYSDGDSAPPDCFSLDGAVPSPGSPLPQAKSCAACPKNVFGSAPPRDGVASKAKACADNRKLAIIPLDDMDNEGFGGPMLFRVPPGALQDLAKFGSDWKQRGYPYNAIAIRLGMDVNVSYPKPTFTAIRPLTSEEAQRVLAMMHTPQVEKILNDFDAAAAPASFDTVGPAFADTTAETASRAAPPPVATPKPAPAPQAAPAPVSNVAAATVGGKPKPAAPTQAAPAAQGAPVATFGKAKVTAAPAPTQAAPATPTAAKPVKARAKPAAAPAPAPVAETPVEEVVVEDPSAGGSADADIESILAELGSVAGG